MGVRAGPGWGEELHRQDELLAWHRLKLWPRSPTHHYDMSHPQHPRDPQCNCQHLLSHSVRAFAGFDTLPSVQPLFPTCRSSTGCTSPLPLLLGLLHTLLGQRGLPPQLPNGSELRPAHTVTVHQGGTQDEGAPEAEVGARGGRSCFRTQSQHPCPARTQLCKKATIVHGHGGSPSSNDNKPGGAVRHVPHLPQASSAWKREQPKLWRVWSQPGTAELRRRLQYKPSWRVP